MSDDNQTPSEDDQATSAVVPAMTFGDEPVEAAPIPADDMSRQERREQRAQAEHEALLAADAEVRANDPTVNWDEYPLKEARS